jgi:hypothetical protein
MARARVLLVIGFGLGLLGLMVPAASAQTGPPPQAGFGLSHHAVCGTVPAGRARCFADVVEHGRKAGTEATTAPTGLSPSALQSVYGYTTDPTAGAGKTIAIVDANDDPTAESDLGAFSSQFGLPACTTSNGCFAKVDQTGGTSYPSVDAGWAVEISLDVQWAHAVAPGAKILLVEASSASLTDLVAAEDYAKAHAGYVSNSWGTSEFLFESFFDSDFTQPGVSIFAASGDSGLPASWPSASPSVISVGGTTLQFDANNNFTGETGWSSGGGGCSAYESASSAQASFAQYGQANCGGSRATPDVAADADPASGVSVYDSTPYSGQMGWYKIGGTSVSSPLWAARSAVQGVTVDAGYVYGTGISFRDITSGNNGAPCLVGFDLCSGRGSWADTATTPPPPPPVDTQPPTVAITAPATSAWVRGSVSVSANAADNVAVDHVAFFDGSTLIGTDTSAPYSVPWATSGDGPHNLTATAFDTSGNSASDTRAVSVDNTPPTATVTSPTGGTVSGTITVTADSSDPSPGSGVASVQFLIDGNVVATDVTAPYSTSWNSATTTNGSHAISVRAADGAGNVTTSPAAQVTVSNATPAVVVHITSLNGHGQVGLFNWTSWVDVTVADQNGQPVSGVTVTFAVSGGTTTTRSCKTGSTGSCSTKNSKVSLSTSKTSVTYITSNVAKTGTTWDGVRWGVTLQLQ